MSRSAVKGNMDNLAISGMIALGNSFFNKNSQSAEGYFRRALDLAQRSKVRRYEALASIALGSLFEQMNRPADARRFTEVALEFYRPAGYRREFIQCMIVLGGVLYQLGEFSEGIKVLREALPGAVALQDAETEELLRQRLVENLLAQGSWPEALQISEHSVHQLGPSVKSLYARMNCSKLYSRLGRPRDAERSLAEAARLKR